MKKLKLNDVVSSSRVLSAEGNFAAIDAFCVEYGSKDPNAPKVVVATMNGAFSAGVRGFVSPVFPRGARFSTSKEVFDANLDAQAVRIFGTDLGRPTLVVSGHAGTRILLAEMYPEASIAEGNVTAEQVRGQVVVGTLPPHLVAEARAYLYAQIRNFDYSKDADLAGDELRERLVVNPPVLVTVD